MGLRSVFRAVLFLVACFGVLQASHAQQTPAPSPPEHDYLFITGGPWPSTGGNLWGFSFDQATETVIPLLGSPVEFSLDYIWLPFTTSGHRLFVFGWHNNVASISTYTLTIVDGGILPEKVTSLGPLVDNPGVNPGGMAVDPAGRFLYVVTQSDVLVFRIEQNGGLTKVPTSSPFTEDSSLFPTGSVLISPDGRWMFLQTRSCSRQNGCDSYITVLPLEPATGQLKPGGIPGVPVPGYGDAQVPVMTFAGNMNAVGSYLVVAEPGAFGVFAFDPATVTLKEVPGSPFQTGLGYFNPTVDPTGRYVFADGGANLFAVFKVEDATGALTQITPPLPFGPADATWTFDTVSFAFSSDGTHIFAASSGWTIDANGVYIPHHDVNLYQLDRNFDELRQLPTPPVLEDIWAFQMRMISVQY